MQLWERFRQVISEGYGEGGYLAAINLCWDRYNAEKDAEDDLRGWYGT